jgi:hypothetical protein
MPFILIPLVLLGTVVSIWWIFSGLMGLLTVRPQRPVSKNYKAVASIRADAPEAAVLAPEQTLLRAG